MNATKNIQQTWTIIIGLILTATPAIASNPIENMIIGLRDNGFGLVMLWLLTLAIVYGILTKLQLPNSNGTRGVIAIASSFLVLIAAAGTGAALFLTNFITFVMVIGVGIIMTLVLLEISGAKFGDVHIFGKYPTIFAPIILAIAVALFLAAAGINPLAIFNAAWSSVLVCGIFLFIVVATVWTLMKSN
jgi:hypothetical protein